MQICEKLKPTFILICRQTKIPNICSATLRSPHTVCKGCTSPALSDNSGFPSCLQMERDRLEENKNFQKRKFSTTTEQHKFLRPTHQLVKIPRLGKSSDSCNNESPSNEMIKISAPYKVKHIREHFPKIKDNEVLIRIDSVAISGSDLHVFETGGKKYPGIKLGCEASGVIEKVGKCICPSKIGDHVAIETGVPCLMCDICKAGAYNVCPQMTFNQCLAKYCAHPADFSHKLPENVHLEEGALVQPLALGCQACCKANSIIPSSSILVIGSDAVAISAAICAKSMGAERVCIACSMAQNLNFAKDELRVVDRVVCVDSKMEPREILERIHCSLGTWPDVVLNCAVCEATMNTAIGAIKPCGTCILAECFTECACFNLQEVLMKDVKIIPSFRLANMFPLAIQLLESGRAPIGGLISHCYDWNLMEDAFQCALSQADSGNRKVVVKCNEEIEGCEKGG